MPWEDQEGNQGAIMANSVHLQPYYPLPDSFPNVGGLETTYTGTRLEGAVDVDHPPLLISARRAFGYADNQARGSAPYTLPDNPYTPEVENSGGDAFDISWAMDEAGNYVELERIHFVKVQSGILHQGGFLGELSTEITGAIDVAPAQETGGTTALLLVKDLPTEMDNTTQQLEAFLFRYGKLVEGGTFRWTCSEEWAVVDEDHRLTMTGTGPLTISVTVDEEPPLSAEVSTLITENISTSSQEISRISSPRLYPNPVGESVSIHGVDGIHLTLFDASGRVLKQQGDYREGSEISCGDLPPGIYMVKLGLNNPGVWLKLLKQ